MSSILKKGFLLGLGAALLSKEKVEEKLNEFVEKNELSSEEAKEMMRELIGRGEEKTAEWGMKQDEQTEKLIREIGLITKEDFDLLQDRVSQLEAALNNHQED